MGSYSDRGGDRVVCLSLICGALRYRRLASPTTRCNAQVYKLLPLPLQGLYRGLQVDYSALQAFTALAVCILWLFGALLWRGRGGLALCGAITESYIGVKQNYLPLSARQGRAGERRQRPGGRGCAGSGSPVCYISLEVLDKKLLYYPYRLDLYPKLNFV